MRKPITFHKDFIEASLEFPRIDFAVSEGDAAEKLKELRFLISIVLQEKKKPAIELITH